MLKERENFGDTVTIKLRGVGRETGLAAGG